MSKLIELTGPPNEDGKQADYAIDPNQVVSLTGAQVIYNEQSVRMVVIQLTKGDPCCVLDPNHDVIARINKERT